MKPSQLQSLPAQVPSSAALWTWGLPKGTEIFVRKVAPLGDPLEITVRGYELSIRKNEAGNIEVA